MLSAQFKQRLSIGSMGSLILVFVIYYSQISSFKPIFVMLTAAAICFALLEYYHLSVSKNLMPASLFGITAAITYIIAVAFSFHHNPFLKELPSIILWCTFLLGCLMFFNHRSFPLVNIAVTFFGLIYIVIPLSFVLHINYFLCDNTACDGRLWLSYVLIVTKSTDMGAYFFGKTLGKHKLAPYISPNKTLEGALGGLLVAIFYSVLFSFFLSGMTNFHLTTVQSVLLGAILGVLSQLGDLVESMFKRDAGVKDSSHLPGLGGMLDVVDSLVFTVPLVYLLLRMRIIGELSL